MMTKAEGGGGGCLRIKWEPVSPAFFQFTSKDRSKKKHPSEQSGSHYGIQLLTAELGCL
jgi:hypothetical protein